MGVKLIVETDDRLGRKLSKPELSGIKMSLKEDWEMVKKAGDYTFIPYETIDCLIVMCPFCGFEAPVPWLVKVESKDPLEIKQELYCEKCHTIFHVIQGSAYKSWIPLDALKKCLDKK